MIGSRSYQLLRKWVTMIDTLTKYGNTPFVKDMEKTMTQLSQLTIRPAKKIKVAGDHPWFEQPVTVQVKEDDIVTFCNHAGHEAGVFYIDDLLRAKGELCDKCEAWSYDGEEWHE